MNEKRQNRFFLPRISAFLSAPSPFKNFFKKIFENKKENERKARIIIKVVRTQGVRAALKDVHPLRW